VTSVAIVGGGVSGLATAYYVSRAGCHATVVEAEARLGGVIRTETVDGCLVEAGPDSFISQKPWGLELIRELGLEAEVIGSQDHLRKTYVARRGRLLPLPDGLHLMIPTAVWPILASPLLSLATKCRMALDLLRRPVDATADRSVAEFVGGHYGREAVDYLAEPLLAGIYGGDAAELSASAVLPRLVDLERRHGSLTRGVLAGRAGTAPGPLFLTLKGGMQRLIDALERSIAGRVAVVRAAVESVEGSSGHFRVRAGTQTIDAGQVVVATPAHAAGRLLRGLDEALAGRLAEIPYHSSVTVALGYGREGFAHPRNGFGFLVPRVERRLLTACTWVGTKFAHRESEDRVLLRAFVGAGKDQAVLGRSDASIVEAVRQELGQLMSVSGAPVFSRVYRWPRAMAQYTVGHERRVEEIKTRLARLPGLHLAGNAYLGIGIPDCIRAAQLAAERVVGVP